MATAKRFDVKNGISVNGLPFVDSNRNVVVNDLTVQGVSTIVDTRTITSVDPIISLGASGATYITEDLKSNTYLIFSLEAFSDIAVGDAIKYDSGDITGLTAGTTYYVVNRITSATSPNYRGIQISLTQGGAAITGLSEGVPGGNSFTLNPLRDLDQDLGVEFNYVSGTPKKGFFGYQDTTGHFTFLLDATYGGSSTESDNGSPAPVFTGTRGGLEVRYVKLQPTASLTTSSPAIDIDQTWSNVGSTFKAIDLSIVDSSSTANSSLLDFTVNSSQKLLLRKDGALAVNTGTITAGLTIEGVPSLENTIYAGSTWNNGSTLFTGIKLNVVDTASAANSLLLDLEVGGVTKFSVDKDGDVFAAGDLTIEGNTTFNGAGSFEDSISIQTQANGTGVYTDNSQFQTTYKTIAAGVSSSVVVNSFAAATYVTGKYLIQVKQGTSYHTAELLLIHDGSTVFLTEYGAVWNSSILGLFDAAITSGQVELSFTPTSAAVAANAQIDVRVLRTVIVA